MKYKCLNCNSNNWEQIKKENKNEKRNIITIIIELLKSILSKKDIELSCKKCGRTFFESDLIRNDVSSLNYNRNDFLLTKVENEFYQLLKNVTPNDTVIFPQVPLHAIVRAKDQGSRNRIDRKRLDYVIFSDKFYNPLLVIELDDSSHLREDRIKRDKFVDNVLFKANIPILHVNIKDRFNKDFISESIEKKINIWEYKR